ncbi:MAG: hypothetical protein HPY62_05510 [Bacteroidales bacterium]|nr:hypothetical protein [Bacteroidales bacterium]
MRKEFRSYYPKTKGSPSDEWMQCLKSLSGTLTEKICVLKLNIFAGLSDTQSYYHLKSKVYDSLKELFGGRVPAFSLILQPPEESWTIAVEALLLDIENELVSTKYLGSIPYVVVESGTIREIYVAGLGSVMEKDGTRDAGTLAFNQMIEILALEKMTMNDVVRQWNYIGEILTINSQCQNYQIFNEVRSEFYKAYRTLKSYPAATGIGMQLGGVIMDFNAVRLGERAAVFPVTNPHQLNAYEYSQNVLKGLPDKGKPQKNPPQFERALFLYRNGHGTLFISGTASIIGQETIGEDDIEKQTLVTIDNIMQLADTERVRQLIKDKRINETKFLFIRTYIKNKSDFESVKKICNQYFPGVPAIYIQADICRDNLLVEIEAEAEVTFRED